MMIIDLLSANQPFLLTAALVLGLLVGSFLNVVVYRLPIMLQREWKQQCSELLKVENQSTLHINSSVKYKVFNLQNPASHCRNCNHKIKPWENVPVISYLALRGRCSNCKSRISLRYPIVELANGLLSALVAFTFGPNLLTLALLFFTWALVTLTLIDFDHQLLPDSITIPLLWFGIGINAFDLGLGVSLHDAVIGAIAGYLVLWSFYWVFKVITGKEGMGYGDFKLLAAMGAWMGWQTLLPIIVLSSLVGAVFGIVMILAIQRDISAPMPFGPYLTGAGFIMLIWGPQISSFYLRSFVG